MKKSVKINNHTINLSIYLTILIPSILFFLFWITLLISIPLTLISFYIIFKYHKININDKDYFEIPLSHLGIMAIILFYTLYSCGIGQFSLAKEDLLLRSNMIFSHLIYNDWPVFVEVENTNYSFLSYYLAYFIPITFITKIIPGVNIYYLEFIWAFSSIYIGLIFFYNYCAKGLVFLIIFLPNGIYWIIDKYLFKDPVPMKYLSSLMTLAHGPQQLISTILGLCIILSELDKKKNSIFIVNIIALVFFWSPFISIALALIVIPQIKYIKVICLENIASIIILFIFVIFYAEKETHFFAHLKSISEINYQYLLFYLGDLILITILLKKYSRRKISLYQIYILVILMIVPFIHFGKHNDFMTKVSTPLILMHYLFLIREIRFKDVKYNMGVFAIIGIYSVSSAYQLINPMINRPTNIDYISTYSNKSMMDVYKDKDIHAQFYSNKNSVFCRYFLK
jgi:hypothetical protein